MPDLVGDPNVPLISIVRAPPPVTMTREVFSGVRAAALIALQAAANRTPLFLVHGGDGDVLSYAVLARHLGPDQPTYVYALAVSTRIVNSVITRRDTADYRADVRGVHPHGPYVLGGACLG